MSAIFNGQEFTLMHYLLLTVILKAELINHSKITHSVLKRLQVRILSNQLAKTLLSIIAKACNYFDVVVFLEKQLPTISSICKYFTKKWQKHFFTEDYKY